MEITRASAGRPVQGRQRKRINVGRAERKASLAGGTALALSGLKSLAGKRYLQGLAMFLAGALFIYRGKTGHCVLYQAIGADSFHSEHPGLRIEKVLTVNRPPQQVYEFWRNLENLPRFMHRLESVQMTGDKTSHWKARGPGAASIEWDAEMMDDYPGQQISWHSTGVAELPNKGTVEFTAAPGDRGTEVRVCIDYYPPGGAAGRAAARLARGMNAQQLEEDLKRLKQILETGEIAAADAAGSQESGDGSHRGKQEDL